MPTALYLHRSGQQRARLPPPPELPSLPRNSARELPRPLLLREVSVDCLLNPGNALLSPLPLHICTADWSREGDLARSIQNRARAERARESPALNLPREEETARARPEIPPGPAPRGGGLQRQGAEGGGGAFFLAAQSPFPSVSQQSLIRRRSPNRLEKDDEQYPNEIGKERDDER
ncbi:hypothetical protein CDL15_Pgr023262 [Punica granatum]|uniref:Uncharacterized protein n=1 Tax=Punica granatum TaxID=22663 RepID=A0A218X5B2_PUNGR|nr:hypothetical protein CDL15_Pgr023262 [Punica granatum]